MHFRVRYGGKRRYTLRMLRRPYIILAGTAVAILIIGGAALFLGKVPASVSQPEARVVPPIETRVAVLDTLAEGGANASTSAQAPEEKLRTLESLSKQNEPSQNAANSGGSSLQSGTAASSTAPAPDTSGKLDVLRSMRGQ